MIKRRTRKIRKTVKLFEKLNMKDKFFVAAYDCFLMIDKNSFQNIKVKFISDPKDHDFTVYPRSIKKMLHSDLFLAL